MLMFVTGYDPYAIPRTVELKRQRLVNAVTPRATAFRLPSTSEDVGPGVRFGYAWRARAAYGQDPHSPSYLQINTPHGFI